jgi:archaellum component FlaC/major membrane immunogen (membrane-anchored lipoprotein)
MRKTKRDWELGIVLACLLLLLAGCGNSKSADYSEAEDTYSGEYDSDYDADVYDEDSAQVNGAGIDADYDGEESSETQSESASADNAKEGSASTEKSVSKEMIVYRGNLVVDTLDFEKSVSDFKKLLDSADGFVESETYTDDADVTNHYVVPDESKNNIYTATVRVPSSEYNSMMDSGTTLGDLRSQSSNAENVTKQYGTYQSELEVYQTEYKRYMQLLENATEDEYALKIEQELFSLQVKIADLKSNMENIETDVAYSYIDITIHEVSKYADTPKVTDTFFERLKTTCRTSVERFLSFLEGILFFFIMAWYYLVILAVIVVLIVRKCRKKKKTAPYARPDESSETLLNGDNDTDGK